MAVNRNIPSYASNRYRNTVELLENSERIAEGVDAGHIDLNAYEKKRFDQFSKTLTIKEKVLGYLEGLTGGTYHKEHITKDSLRRYTDWLLSDTPIMPFPSEQFPDALVHANWLRSHIQNHEQPSSAKRDVLRSLYLESRPEIPLDKVENLVLAGGGAKALSLAGVVASLERKGVNKQIQRVAGTSGGAIIALAFSAGYNSKELESLVLNNHFGLFTLGSNFDNRILNQWSQRFARDEPSSKLHVLSDNSLAHTYHTSMMQALGEVLRRHENPKLIKFNHALQDVEEKHAGVRLAKVLKNLPNKDVLYHALLDQIPVHSQIAIDNRAKELTVQALGRSDLVDSMALYATPRAAMIGAMRHRTGQDIIRGFFSDLVFDKLNTLPRSVLRHALYGEKFKDDPARIVHNADLRNISFTQWQRLHEMMPETIKELHISMSILKPISKRIKGMKYDPYRHEDAAYDNPDFADMSVVDAVRVSMNLPPIYPRYDFTVNGQTHKGSDGGLKSNMSLGTFDKRFLPEQTIGVFYKTGAELEAAKDVDRMLVIPRTLREASADHALATLVDMKAGIDIMKIKIDMGRLLAAEGESSEAYLLKKSEMERSVDYRRDLGIIVEGYSREIAHIEEVGGGGVL